MCRKDIKKVPRNDICDIILKNKNSKIRDAQRVLPISQIPDLKFSLAEINDIVMESRAVIYIGNVILTIFALFPSLAEKSTPVTAKACRPFISIHISTSA